MLVLLLLVLFVLLVFLVFLVLLILLVFVFFLLFLPFTLLVIVRSGLPPLLLPGWIIIGHVGFRDDGVLNVSLLGSIHSLVHSRLKSTMSI